MRALRRLFRTIFVTNRSLTAVAVLWASCIIIALSTGFWLSWRLAYIAMVGVPIAYIWSRFNLSGLEVEPDRHTDRLQEGAQFEEEVTVKNNSWLGKIWLEVDDPSDMPGHKAKRVITVG